MPNDPVSGIEKSSALMNEEKAHTLASSKLLLTLHSVNRDVT